MAKLKTQTNGMAQTETKLGSVLSNRAVLRHIEEGNVVIHPFNPDQLKTSSYDLTLGEWYFTPQPIQNGLHIYNPFDEAEVRRIWGEPQRAPKAKDIAEWAPTEEIFGAGPEDRVILIPPQQVFLCHTQEFIGGKNCVTTMMHARSSWGRNFIEVCRDAGWGDVGYINRWTMEVANTSTDLTIALVVGRRIAQMIFFEVEPPLEIYHDYASTGKYQTADTLKELKKNWSPYDMLPKLFKDPEVRGFKSRTRPGVKITSQRVSSIYGGGRNG